MKKLIIFFLTVAIVFSVVPNSNFLTVSAAESPDKCNECYASPSSDSVDFSVQSADSTGFKVPSSTDLSAFPVEYQSVISSLMETYPNYVFVPDYIDYTLNEAVTWHYYNGAKVMGNGSTSASWGQIEYYMDPMTYLEEGDIYIFAYQAFSEDQDADGLSSLFSHHPSTFLNTQENIQALIEAGRSTGLSPYVIASTIILEKGWDAQDRNPDVYGRTVWSGTAAYNADVYSASGGWIGSISSGETVYIYGNFYGGNYRILYNGSAGYVSRYAIDDASYYNTYYNLFSVNQTDDNPVAGGISYAMANGWDTLAKSLVGGAEFYRDYYYDNGQNTYYYKDFNVINSKSNWWHEYATGIQDANTSGLLLGYCYAGSYDDYLVLRIPIYEGGTPQAPVPKSVSNTADGISLSWNSVGFADGYTIYRSENDGNYTKIASTEKTKYEDLTAVPGTLYRYVVRAYRVTDGTRTYGGYVKTGFPVRRLEAPVITSCINAINGIKLRWGSVAGATKYRVYRKTGEDGTWKYLGYTTKTYCTDKKAEPGVEYYYCVRAYHGSGHSISSTETSKRIFIETPELIEAKVYETRIKVTWTGSEEAVKYYFYRRESQDDDWTYLGNTKRTYWNDRTVEKGKTYYYTVRAVSGEYRSNRNQTGVSASF